MILVYKGQDRGVFDLQKDYWINGNKNEFVTCIGVDATNLVTWVDCFCWENEGLKVAARNQLSEQIGKRLDAKSYIDWLGQEVPNSWHRKHFKDFSYLTVEPAWWIVLLVYLFVTIITVGTLYGEVVNDITPRGLRK